MAEDIRIVIDAVDKSKPGFQQLERNMQGAADESEKSSKAIKANYDAALKGIAATSAIAFGALVVASAGAVKAAANLESLNLRLEQLKGSAEAGHKAFKFLVDYSAGTPFKLPDIISGAATLEAFGANAEELIPIMGDLAVFMGVNIPEAAMSFGRAFAAGAGAADIFREKGILNLISMRTGIQDLTSLTLPEFRIAMIEAFTDPDGRITGGTAKLAQTLEGRFSTLADNAFLLSAAIGETLADDIKRVNERLIDVLETSREWIEINPELSETILKVSTALTGLVFAVTSLTIAYSALKKTGLLGIATTLARAVPQVAAFAVAITAANIALREYSKFMEKIPKHQEEINLALQNTLEALGEWEQKTIDTRAAIEEAAPAIIDFWTKTLELAEANNLKAKEHAEQIKAIEDAYGIAVEVIGEANESFRVGYTGLEDAAQKRSDAELKAIQDRINAEDRAHKKIKFLIQAENTAKRAAAMQTSIFVNQAMGAIINTEMTGKEKREAIWRSLTQAILSMITQIIIQLTIAKVLKSALGLPFLEGGGLIGSMQTGGFVSGRGGIDKIPVRLTQGEFVMPAEQTARYYPMLEMMRGMQAGGAVTTYDNSQRSVSVSVGDGANVNVAELAVVLIPELERAIEERRFLS